jgi:hypothetical protein
LNAPPASAIPATSSIRLGRGEKPKSKPTDGNPWAFMPSVDLHIKFPLEIYSRPDRFTTIKYLMISRQRQENRTREGE